MRTTLKKKLARSKSVEIGPVAKPKKQKRFKDMTRGERVIAFIERFLHVPEGKFVGQKVVLEEFQKEFILAVYDNPHITDTAILSIARKNAKTALIAFIVIVHLVGPEAVQNSRIISGALSLEQAAEVFNLAYKTFMASPKLEGLIHPVLSRKRLRGVALNVEYQAISAEGKTAHGKSPIVAILDEVGQIDGPSSPFVDAITTAQGAYEDPLLFYISTQAASDGDFLSIQIDDALQNKPPKTVCRVYAAEEFTDPKKAREQLLDVEQWRMANPALGSFRSMKDMRKQAEKAARMPSFENTFRNLNLNQRVSASTAIVSRALWLAAKVEADKFPTLGECDRIVGGIDLSGKIDLTAIVFLGEKDGVWYVYAFFWMPEEGLLERENRDKAPYTLWKKQGFLRTTPGKAVRYRQIAKELKKILEGIDVDLIEKVNYDRWRIDLLKEELAEIGIDDFPLAECGQGFKDMSPCIEAFEDLILNDQLKHDGNPVLTMCVANGRIVSDGTESRKFNKKATTKRMDGLVALAMGCGATTTPGDDGDMSEFLKNRVVIPRK